MGLDQGDGIVPRDHKQRRPEGIVTDENGPGYDYLDKPAAQPDSLRLLQERLPWTIHYDSDFRASPVAHKDFQHALLHVLKASGKIASVVNDAEHAGTDWNDPKLDDYIADLVVCALRMANTIPGRKLDLGFAVVKRIENKNGVKL